MSVLDRETGQPVFPSWRQLLRGAADRLEQETKTAEADVIRSLMNLPHPDFLYAATQARKGLGPLWYEYLKEKIEIPFEKIDPESLELARRIWRLGSNLIITTNYDEVLKWACPNRNDLQSWDIEATVEQALLLKQGIQRPVIWHLHGRISKASDLILSPDGYQRLYPETDGTNGEVTYEAALSTLRLQIASKSLLFIGFSLDDEHLDLQLRGVQEIYKGAVGPHYAVVREEQAERVRSLNIEPIPVSDFGDSLMMLMADLEAATETEASAVIAGASTKPSVIPDYGPHRSVFYVPFKQKGDEIVGQQRVIEDVRRQLTQGKRTAIGQTAAFRGLGGLGKTQLAIEYAYRYRDEYPNGVIWLNADQDIDAQLIEIAERARWIAPESDHKYKIQIAQQRLRSYSDCLIIFDNLDDRKAIDSYLPEPEANPHILITSRIDHVDFQPIPLGLLDEHLSRELLIREARRQPQDKEEEEAITGIVVLLEGLPLALELAGAYLGHRRSVTFQRYYDLLGRDLKSALPKSVSSFTKHEADLYSTLRLSEDLLKEEDRLRDVLDLLTWSGSAPMSINLIAQSLDSRDEGALAGALAFGAELRLLRKSKNADNYSLHRLVGEVRRGEIPLVQRADWVDAICNRLGDWFQQKRKDFSQLTTFESEIDHLKSWQQNAVEFAPSHASRLMWLQAYPAYYRGRYVESRDFVVRGLNLLSLSTHKERELEANLLNDLAYTSAAAGDFESVLANYNEALVIRRELFGEQHEEVATSLENIGYFYGELGDFQLALDYSQQALVMRRVLFGRLHQDIATSLRNVGSCYGRQGNPRRALEYSKEALSMQRELFGDRHPDIATSLNDVGVWCGEKKDLNCALEYSELALAMRRELFGELHPATTTSLNNVAGCYGRRGDPERALAYLEHALELNRKIYGDVHPDIALVLGHIGYWSRKQGKLPQALHYSQQALAMYTASLGDQHHSTINAARSVAINLLESNKLQQAYDLVTHFLKLPSQGPAVDRLKALEKQLLSKTIRKGFRQLPRKGKLKKKKRR